MFIADNMRYLLELSRSGRLAEVAKRFGVDETTVSRHISKLEKDLGKRVFDRGAAGWQLTDAGRALLPYAEVLEATVRGAVEAIGPDETGGVAGTARLLAPDGFGAFLLMPALGRLRAAHPNLAVEVVTSTSHDLLTGRDFDVAITLDRPPARSVTVRKLADYRLHLYAARSYLADRAAITSLTDLAEQTLIWYVDTILDVEPLRILDDLLPGCRAVVQTNNIAGHYQAVRSGVGIAPLPSYLGEGDPDLVRVLPDEFIAHRTYWLVVPRELGNLAVVKAVTTALFDLVARHPELTPAT